MLERGGAHHQLCPFSHPARASLVALAHCLLRVLRLLLLLHCPDGQRQLYRAALAQTAAVSHPRMSRAAAQSACEILGFPCAHSTLQQTETKHARQMHHGCSLSITVQCSPFESQHPRPWALGLLYSMEFAEHVRAMIVAQASRDWVTTHIVIAAHRTDMSFGRLQR